MLAARVFEHLDYDEPEERSNTQRLANTLSPLDLYAPLRTALLVFGARSSPESLKSQ